MSGMFKLFGGSLINGAEKVGIGSTSKGMFGSTISNMMPTVFSGLSFAGKGLLSLTTSSISLIISVGGGLLMLLMSQKQNTITVK